MHYVIVALLVAALVLLVGLRVGGKAGAAVGCMRVSRDRRARRDRRQRRDPVVVERRRGPRRHEEVANRFLRRLEAASRSPRSRA
jgi:hypothetical protein